MCGRSSLCSSLFDLNTATVPHNILESVEVNTWHPVLSKPFGNISIVGSDEPSSWFPGLNGFDFDYLPLMRYFGGTTAMPSKFGVIEVRLGNGSAILLGERDFLTNSQLSQYDNERFALNLFAYGFNFQFFLVFDYCLELEVFPTTSPTNTPTLPPNTPTSQPPQLNPTFPPYAPTPPPNTPNSPAPVSPTPLIGCRGSQPKGFQCIDGNWVKNGSVVVKEDNLDISSPILVTGMISSPPEQFSLSFRQYYFLSIQFNFSY